MQEGDAEGQLFRKGIKGKLQPAFKHRPGFKQYRIG